MRKLICTPLTSAFGVNVHDVQLKELTGGDGYAALRDLFEEHSALLFRDQQFDDDAHLQLARSFGPIEDRNADERDKDEKFAVPLVSNVQADGSLTSETDMHTLHLKANFLWHADSTFLPVPALTNILVARVVSADGGATELASTRAGWAAMPETLKSRIRGRGLWHRYAHSRARISPELAQLPMFNKWPDQHWNSVWNNPVNGREALYIASHTFRVDGLDTEESQALIDELVAYCTQPEFVYSHRWSVGDVMIWDQRAVLHRGQPWPANQPRTLSSICVSVQDRDGLGAMRLPLTPA